MKTHITNCIFKVMINQFAPWLLVVALLYLAAMTGPCGYGTLLRASVNWFWLAILTRVSCTVSHSKIFRVYGISSVQCRVRPQP